MINKKKKPNIISMTALKGGTGKTLLTFNVATLLAKKYSKKVLVIDIDPQHNMTNLLSDPRRETGRVIEDVFENGLEAEEVVQDTHINGVDVIPTTLGLTVTDVQISGLAGRESILKNWVYDNEAYLSRYDYVFFDSNPTMSIINMNAFLCCDSIVLVSDIDRDAIGAVNTFMYLYYPIRDRVDRRLEDNIKALIINKVDDSTNMTRDFLRMVDSKDFQFADLLLKSKIHSATALSETKSTKQPITKQDNKRSYNEFIALIDEMMEEGVL